MKYLYAGILLLLILNNKIAFAYNCNHHAKLSSDFIVTEAIKKLQRNIDALNIFGLTVTSIQFMAKDSYTGAGINKQLKGLPAFCLVAATLKPTAQSNIKIELWLPISKWNGRFLGTGNGGGGGNIDYNSLANGIKKGYATANTDLGTSPDANVVGSYLERWVDFGYRATHLMTITSKAIIKVFYGKTQKYAYFVGCSTGGQQALMEAQRFPTDYNGIIAGAPANNRTHLHTDFLFNYKETHQGNGTSFSQKNLDYITKTIIAAFAGKDGGAPGDHFLTDPRKAKFNPEILFKANKTLNDSNLTSLQIAVLKRIYAGPLNPLTGEQIYTSFPVGSENSAGGLNYQQTEIGRNDLFYQYKWVFGSGFDYSKFDFDKDQVKLDSLLAHILNANSPDLRRLKQLGGKLIMYTGTADPLVPYGDAINYYERVIQQQRNLKNTQVFFRYFLVPGMGHCSGGPGLNDFGQNIGTGVKQDSNHDVLLALRKWVEQGVAPYKIIATALNCCNVPKAQPFDRPIYPYPKFPDYIKGDVNSPSSYKGIEHKRGEILMPAGKYLK